MRRLLFAVGVAVLVPLAAGPAARAEAPKKVDKKQEAKKSAGKPTVAVFRMDGDASEGPVEDSFLFGSVGKVAFKDLVGRLTKAGDDPAVKAVVLLIQGSSYPAAQTEEL